MTFFGWIDLIRSRWSGENAQTMAEYAVVLGVIVPAIVITYGLFSGDIATLVNSVRSLL
jgi:Flp pilus assembly pilin Flp